MTGVEREAEAFIGSHVGCLIPLETEANLAQWEAATTGAPAAAERHGRGMAELKRLHSDPAAARRVRAWRTAADCADPLLRRQLVLLDHAFTANQLPAGIITDLTGRAAALEQSFYTFRAPFEGTAVSNNELLEVLRTERDSDHRRAAWEASKEIAREVAEPLRELVRRRNAAAHTLGFPDFYTMELTLQEIDDAQLFRLLDEFRELSDEPFRRLRSGIDHALAERYGIAPAELRPWHWEDFFCQEAPSIGTTDLDDLYRERDLVATASEYFDRIGLPVADVLARSDLFEREGKDQHAFATDIDREGDVRILCNLRPREKWMGTLLHELGHASYDKFLPRSLPYLLRKPAHTLSTEAIAMYMGRLTRDPSWIRDTLGATIDEPVAADVARQLRASMLISTRWMLVMVYFERELYRNPDRHDLNELWWDLVERNQFIRRPDDRDEPDWAAKLHFSVAPVYYHSYLLGELMASQLDAHVRRAVRNGAESHAPSDPGIGVYLRDRVFAPGASLDWNRLLVHATGEPLQSRYFVEQFVDG